VFSLREIALLQSTVSWFGLLGATKVFQATASPVERHQDGFWPESDKVVIEGIVRNVKL